MQLGAADEDEDGEPGGVPAMGADDEAGEEGLAETGGASELAALDDATTGAFELAGAELYGAEADGALD